MSHSTIFFLAALLGLGASEELFAQLPAESELLKVSAPQPNTVKRLALEEFQTVVVRYKNKTKTTATVLAMPYTNGRPTPGYGYKPLSAEPRSSETVEVSFTCYSPAVVDEIRVKLRDLVTKEELAVVSVPVQMTWGDGKPAPPPPPATVIKPAPAPMPKPAAGQPGMMRFELQGYEVSQDAAAMLFISQSGELDPKALLTATAALVGARKATIVKLPFIEAASRARAVAAPVGGYSLEAQLTGGGGGYVEAIYALRRASDQSGTTNGMVAKVGGITFMGSLPGSSADKVVLMFARITDK